MSELVGETTSQTTPPKIKRKGLGYSAILVSAMTLLSRLFGFVRDVMVAHFFGAEAAVDAFWIAFKIPNFMRRLFAEGAFSQAFVPVLSEYQQKKTHKELENFVHNMAGILLLALLAVTVIAIIAAPLVVLVFAPGFHADPTRLAYATFMIRITFPYLLFISLTAFAGGVLNSYGNFGVPSFTPVLLNISMILCALFLSPRLEEPIHALAIGVFIGGIAQLVFQIPFLRRVKLIPRFKFNWQDKGVKTVLTLMLPALFGVSVSQVNLMLDTMFASFLQVGSISWLYYSDRLTAFPLGIFGVGVATVILPLLSRKHAEKSLSDFSETLTWATRVILFVGLPAAAGLICLAGPIFATLFRYGAFTARDVELARLSLMALSMGVPAFMLIKVLASGFYSQQNIKTPVRIAVIAMVTNIILNLILIKPLAHAGLALATSISALVNAGLLGYGLWKQQLLKLDRQYILYSIRILLATVLMAGVTVQANPHLEMWFAWDSHSRIKYLLGLIVMAAAIYFMALVILGIRWKDVKPPAREIQA